jgi:hypothetical protein
MIVIIISYICFVVYTVSGNDRLFETANIWYLALGTERGNLFHISSVIVVEIDWLCFSSVKQAIVVVIANQIFTTNQDFMEYVTVIFIAEIAPCHLW